MGNKPLDKTKPKIKHRKGLWSPDEDEKLRNYVNQHGHGCWSSVPINSGLERSGKSCRLRWINYLRPGLKKGTFNPQEEDIILTLHSAFGNKWSQIAQHLPGRTDNEIKNFWHSYLKKKVAKTQKLESIPNTQVINSTFQKDIGSPVKSNTTISSFDLIEKVEGSSMNVTQLANNSNNQSFLPKLFFAEWFNIDNSINIGQSRLLREPLDIEEITSCNVNINQNNSQDCHYPANNRKNNDFVIKNFVLDEGYTQGVTYNQGTSSNDEFCNSEAQNEVFNSQFNNIEDETATFNYMFYENYESENNCFMEGNV